MKILVVGSGGSAHAVVWKLAQSEEVTAIVVTPGSDAMRMIRLVSNEEPVKIRAFHGFTSARLIVEAEHAFDGNYDLVVPIHESCLATGLGDLCRKFGIPFAGPCRRGANFELSKVYTQEFAARHKLPIAPGEVHRTIGSTRDYAFELLKSFGGCVVKADGPARGKSAYVCRKHKDVGAAIREIMQERKFDDSGNAVVIQRLLEGHEFSLHFLCDATTQLPLPVSVDYKRLLEDNKGPQTGGMGAYCEPFRRDELITVANDSIVGPWHGGCQDEELLYRGVLYPGIMIVDDNAQLLEFNARFGDPEAETILLRLESDLAEALYAAATDSLSGINMKWNNLSVVTVVLASRGYPDNPEIGKKITGIDAAAALPNIQIFHMGTKFIREDGWYTNGGRVLAVSASGDTVSDARARVYEAVDIIKFDGKQCRPDIGVVA